MVDNKPLIIIGGEGHGSVIASCVNDNRKRFNNTEWEVVGFCNDYDDEVDGYPVLGKLCDISRLVNEGYFFSWGIHLISNNNRTLELFNSVTVPTNRWATIIHETAYISESSKIKPGAFIMAHSYIGPRSEIGECSMVKANVNIGHDVRISKIAHIAMGANVVSYASIGVCADVAVGSTVLAHSVIGNCSMLGASSLLTHNIPDGEIWIGSPARFMKHMPIDSR